MNEDSSTWVLEVLPGLPGLLWWVDICHDRANIHRAPLNVPKEFSRGWNLCEIELIVRLRYYNSCSVSTSGALYDKGPGTPTPLAE